MANLDECVWRISFKKQLRQRGLDVKATLKEMPGFESCAGCSEKPYCKKYIPTEKANSELVGSAKWAL